MQMLKWIATLIACALLTPAVQAQEAAATPAQQELVEQILELQRRIEELMAALPPGIRAELRQRLAEAPLPAPPAPATLAAPPPVAAAATDPTPVIAEASPGATAVAPAADPPPSDGIPKLIRRRSRRAPCNTLRPFDENGDGKISSADRTWRHLYIWTDRNADRVIQDREVESAYDRRVREIAVSLETFIRTKGGLGEVRIEDQVVLDLRGDGFSERTRRDDGVLAIDAGALNRGDGPRLLGPDGEALSGFVAFRSGLRLELAGGVTELNCP